MKYLLTIFCIAVTITAITIYFVFSANNDHDDSAAVIIINGAPITRSNLQTIKKHSGHHQTQDELFDSVITKQLLIQEAQRLNVDKEHSFRTALKNYYEQSLIKVLSERQYEKIEVKVSDTEVENFINCYGKTFTFIIAKATPEIDVKTVRSRGLQQSLLFDDLGASLKFILAGLKPGDIAISFLTGNEQHAILLEKIEGKSAPAQNMNSEKIRSRLANFKKEQVFNQWINGLRQKATITINEGK